MVKKKKKFFGSEKCFLLPIVSVGVLKSQQGLANSRVMWRRRDQSGVCVSPESTFSLNDPEDSPALVPSSPRLALTTTLNHVHVHD